MCPVCKVLYIYIYIYICICVCVYFYFLVCFKFMTTPAPSEIPLVNKTSKWKVWSLQHLKRSATIFTSLFVEKTIISLLMMLSYCTLPCSLNFPTTSFCPIPSSPWRPLHFLLVTIMEEQRDGLPVSQAGKEGTRRLVTRSSCLSSSPSLGLTRHALASAEKMLGRASCSSSSHQGQDVLPEMPSLSLFFIGWKQNRF